MSQFLDGVHLIKVRSGDATPGTSPDGPGPGETIVQVDPKTGSVNVHKHSSDGDAAWLAVPVCAIFFTFLYLIVKAIMAPFTQRAKYARAMPPGSGGGGLTPEETAVLQKLQRTLSQMESRVEALETILIEQARTEKNYGSKL